MQQQYDQYTAEDHRVWQILFEEQLEQIPNWLVRNILRPSI